MRGRTGALRLRGVRPLPLAFLVALLLAPAAHGATVTRTSEVLDAGRGEEILVHSVTFEAVPGEGNQLAMGIQGGVLTVHDAGAPVAAGKGCAQVDASTVRCAVGPEARCAPCAAVRTDALVRLRRRRRPRRALARRRLRPDGRGGRRE